jgi:hydrogenase maturation protease
LAARVIGIGQTAAGDDGVGIAVVQHLRAQGRVAGAELMEVAEPSALVPALEGADPVILVDAVLGGTPGDVVELTPESLAGSGIQPLSTHGLGVAQAIELARTLAPRTLARCIWIVGVCIAPPAPYTHGLTAPVAAAVPRAAERITNLLHRG